jgi:hypothetical protein
MRLWVLATLLCGLNLGFAARSADRRCAVSIDRVQPSSGVISDERTATAVGLAYLMPIYGSDLIDRQLPLRATLRDGIWTVVGVPPGSWIGGSAEIALCQRNGTVLRIFHSK